MGTETKQDYAKVFCPATIGNVGPGFDVLGLALTGLGDIVSAKLNTDKDSIEAVGVDHTLIPLTPEKNCAHVAAKSMLKLLNIESRIQLKIERQTPIAGGLGSSAAASVGGAMAAALASGKAFTDTQILQASLAGEAMVAGRHLDNIAPCLFGGLCVVQSVEHFQVFKVTPQTPIWLSVITPNLKIATRDARAILPKSLSNEVWIKQMADTTTLSLAILCGDFSAIRRSLNDGFAEPYRAHLIPQFLELKSLSLKAGSLGCSISGAGPSVFAMWEEKEQADRGLKIWCDLLASNFKLAHVGEISHMGARKI
jgi:homoserine kinase